MFLISPRSQSLSFLFRRYFSTSSILCKSSASSNRWLNRQSSDLYTRRAKAENLKSRAAFKLLQIDEKFGIFKKSKQKSRESLNVLDLGAAPGAWNQVSIERSPHGSKILGVDILPYQPPKGASSIQGNILSKGTHKLVRDFFILSELEKTKQIFEDVEIISTADSKPDFLLNSDSEHTIEPAKSVLEQEVEINQLYESEISKNDKNGNTGKLSENAKLFKDYPVDVVLSDMYVPFPKDYSYNSALTNNPYFRMANTTGLAFRDHAMSMDLCDAALITAVDLLKKNGSLVMKFFTGEEDKLLERRLNHCFKTVKRFKPKACRIESKECYFVCMGKKDFKIDKVELFSL